MSRQRRSMVSTLPFELIWEFLSLLPALHVVKCLVVCRAWRSLIETPAFVRHHLRQMNTQNKFGYILDQESRRPIIEVRRDDQTGGGNERVLISGVEKAFDIVGSCDGLLCALGLEETIFLWNPTTNRHRVLPSHSIPFTYALSRATLSFGLGYHEDTDEYKVVRKVTFTGSNQGPYLSIYSSRSNRWNDLGFFGDMECSSEPGVYVKGALHWLVSWGPNSRQVAAFDLGSEQFTIIQTPGDALDPGFPCNIGALDNDTLVHYSGYYFFQNRINLWILREYEDYNSWTQITMDDQSWRDIGGLVRIQPIRFMKLDDSKILMRIDPIGTYGYWDIEENRFYEVEYDVIVSGYSTLNTYIESIEVP